MSCTAVTKVLCFELGCDSMVNKWLAHPLHSFEFSPHSNMHVWFIEDQIVWLFVYMSTAIGCQPDQGVSQLLPKFSQDRLQVTCDPREDKWEKTMDGWLGGCFF